MKSHYILEVDRVLPEGFVQYCWRLYVEPTAQELLDLLEVEKIKEEHNETETI